VPSPGAEQVAPPAAEQPQPAGRPDENVPQRSNVFDQQQQQAERPNQNSLASTTGAARGPLASAPFMIGDFFGDSGSGGGRLFLTDDLQRRRQHQQWRLRVSRGDSWPHIARDVFDLRLRNS
jgi:hypothetical protein